MRFKVGRDVNIFMPHRWFAWRPVRAHVRKRDIWPGLWKEVWVWLEYVERKGVDNWGFYWTYLVEEK